MNQLLKTLLFIGMLSLTVSYFLKDKYPDSSTMLPQLQYEPAQAPVNIQPFTVQTKGVKYLITPLYSYDIHGMVATYHKSDDFTDHSHKRMKDYINVEDICVLWGTNLQGNFYRKLKFTSGDWTCFLETKDLEIYKAFNMSAISNNHLLTSDPKIAKTIRSARRGDQLRMIGYLVRYSNDMGLSRNTSVTRADTGQGACETLYVTDFQILKRGSPVWDPLYKLSKYTIIICAILLVALFIFNTERSK